MTQIPTLILTEQEPAWLPAEVLAEEDARFLESRYGAQIEVTPPSYQTGGRWRLTPRGWVGTIPLPAGPQLHIRPKVPLDNLFQMLGYAYDLVDFRLLDGRVWGRTLPEFYEFLAQEFAMRLERRLQLGLYRAYVPRHALRPAVTGRLDLAYAAHHPAAAGPMCHYEEHTADLPHNQLLAWALRTVVRSGLCGEPVQERLRRLERRLPVTPVPFTAADCLTLTYDRLNEDYRPLHLLSRFFIALTGPAATATEEPETDEQKEPLFPFLVNMNQLFEQFVAAWLARHLPQPYNIRSQERVQLWPEGENGGRALVIDLLVLGPEGRPRCVLDTKYKLAVQAALDDVYQVAFYAHDRGCREAALVYPHPLTQPLEGINRDVRVRSLTFSLAGDLEAAGRAFLEQLQPLLGERP